MISLTCDGPACHALRDVEGTRCRSQESTACNRSSDIQQTTPTKRVHVLLDACHMIKLVRNTFADQRMQIDSEGGVIDWEYVVSLDKLQGPYA